MPVSVSVQPMQWVDAALCSARVVSTRVEALNIDGSVQLRLPTVDGCCAEYGRVCGGNS